MVDFPQAITAFQTWAGTQWEAFQIPPSDIERSTTNNFIYTGLNSNRFLALYKGVGPCAASIVMVVCHPVTGLFKGVIMGLQGNLRDGLWEVGAGIINSTRSCFNAAAVGTTAVVGFLPIPNLNHIMYNAMTPSLTQVKTLATEATQAKATPDQEVQNLKQQLQTLTTEAAQAKATFQELQLQVEKLKGEGSEKDTLIKLQQLTVDDAEKKVKENDEEMSRLKAFNAKHISDAAVVGAFTLLLNKKPEQWNEELKQTIPVAAYPLFTRLLEFKLLCEKSAEKSS